MKGIERVPVMQEADAKMRLEATQTYSSILSSHGNSCPQCPTAFAHRHFPSLGSWNLSHAW